MKKSWWKPKKKASTKKKPKGCKCFEERIGNVLTGRTIVNSDHCPLHGEKT